MAGSTRRVQLPRPRSGGAVRASGRGCALSAACVQFWGAPFCAQPSPSVKITYEPSGAWMACGLWDHGFTTTIRATPGIHQVCVYAIGAPNVELGCRTVVVPG